MGGDIFTAALPVKPVLRLFAFIVTKYDYNGDEMKGEVLVKLKNNALIGIEITFSDVMLSHMRLEIKDYKADPYNNLGFEEYCEQVQTAYHNWWVKYIPLKQKQRQKNISNNYFTLASPGEYLKSKMGSTEPKKKDESSCNMMVKFPYVRDGLIYDPKKDIVRSNG
ncbi:MAG: hypothetical protein FIA91_02885 [Geobacter sp.]|nr:hypothetical protein [Geobacter sp.]